MRNRHNDEDPEYRDFEAAREYARHYYDEEDPDEEPEEDPQDQLLELLRNIERKRERLNVDMAALASLLRRHPDLQRQWHAFLCSGGVSAKDFEGFLEGHFCHRSIRHHRHLRLVVSRKSVPIRRRPDTDPDEAA